MMSRRRGVTLLEVLVAIFVMAIGMLALLVLFPLGALQMAQAIKDNRCLQAAANARATAIALEVRSDLNVTDEMDAKFLLHRAANASYDGPSQPILLDPLATSPGSLGTPAAALANHQIPRITTLRNPIASRYQWFALTDDIEFEKDGSAGLSGASQVRRASRFTWAYLIRRPRYVDRSVTDLSVLIFSNRPRLNPEEPAFEAEGTIDTLSLLLYYNGDKPKIKSNTWLIDTTPEDVGSTDAVKHGPVRSYFYRVVAATDEFAGVLRVELQTPLRATLSRTTPIRSRVVFIPELTEVFDKSTGWKP